MASYVKAIIYTAVAVWAVVLLIGGQKLSSDLLRPVSAVTSIVVIDVGMGIVRVLTCTPDKRDHLDRRMSFGDEDEAENEYATNIQIAELNALNAALAVIRWKRLVGFYRDAGGEHYSSYQIATGNIANEETA